METTMDTASNGQSPANPFTQFYAQLLHQGNMLQDHVRTSTYQNSFFQNPSDFQDKAVLDVGTGTGILAFFALQCGARVVYAVEASDSSETAKSIAEANGYSDRIQIIHGKVEDIELPEKVDVIISEPIGFLLVHERMLESYVVARDKFLAPNGKMYPSVGSIVVAPYTDDALYQEQNNKVAFWQNTNFYGVDLSCVLEKAQKEHFSQAVVGNFSPTALISSQRTVHTIDFTAVSCEELQDFAIPFQFRIDRTAIMHGLGGWFEIEFNGSQATVVLSTAPDKPTTHWYQCRLMFSTPIGVNKGQVVSGTLKFRANEKFSYFVDVSARIDGTNVTTTNTINLHDQMYHYLTASSY